MDKVREAVDVLKHGGVIIYPSVSSYGFGCDATNEEAAKKVYEIKGRSATKGMLMLVDSLEMAKKYGFIDARAEALVKKFMPGPLTLIVPKKKGIPKLVNTDFAFRIDSHPIAMRLVQIFGKPIVTTSTNLTGNSPVYSITEARKQFGSKVDMILDAGDLPKNPPSTIVKDGKVIREGAISEKEILSAISA